MGYFDFLIDKKNLEPKPELTYVYLMDMVWRPNELGHHPIAVGTVVTDVIQKENKSYEFKIPGTEGTWRTNYAWALAENTVENIERIKIYHQEQAKLEEMQKRVDGIRNEIVTLDGKSDLKNKEKEK